MDLSTQPQGQRDQRRQSFSPEPSNFYFYFYWSSLLEGDVWKSLYILKHWKQRKQRKQYIAILLCNHFSAIYVSSPRMLTVWCPTSVAAAAAAAAIEEAETAWLSLARGNWIAHGCNSTELEECWAAGGIRRFQPAAIKQRNDAWNSGEEKKKTEAVGGGVRGRL